MQDCRQNNMTTSSATNLAMTDMDTEMPEALFRAPKRRKIFRSRAREDEVADEAEANITTRTSGAITLDDDGPQLSVAEILRRRKMGKSRKAGVEFNVAKSRSRSTPPPQSTALIPIDEDKAVMDTAVNRFLPEQGPNKVTEVTSKHM
jgi:hypothetical protein